MANDEIERIPVTSYECLMNFQFSHQSSGGLKAEAKSRMLSIGFALRAHGHGLLADALEILGDSPNLEQSPDSWKVVHLMTDLAGTGKGDSAYYRRTEAFLSVARRIFEAKRKRQSDGDDDAAAQKIKVVSKSGSREDSGNTSLSPNFHQAKQDFLFGGRNRWGSIKQIVKAGGKVDPHAMINDVIGLTDEGSDLHLISGTATPDDIAALTNTPPSEYVCPPAPSSYARRKLILRALGLLIPQRIAEKKSYQTRNDDDATNGDITTANNNSAWSFMTRADASTSRSSSDTGSPTSSATSSSLPWGQVPHFLPRLSNLRYQQQQHEPRQQHPGVAPLTALPSPGRPSLTPFPSFSPGQPSLRYDCHYTNKTTKIPKKRSTRSSSSALHRRLNRRRRLRRQCFQEQGQSQDELSAALRAAVAWRPATNDGASRAAISSSPLLPKLQSGGFLKNWDGYVINTAAATCNKYENIAAQTGGGSRISGRHPKEFGAVYAARFQRLQKINGGGGSEGSSNGVSVLHEAGMVPATLAAAQGIPSALFPLLGAEKAKPTTNNDKKKKKKKKNTVVEREHKQGRAASQDDDKHGKEDDDDGDDDGTTVQQAEEKQHHYLTTKPDCRFTTIGAKSLGSLLHGIACLGSVYRSLSYFTEKMLSRATTKDDGVVLSSFAQAVHRFLVIYRQEMLNLPYDAQRRRTESNVGQKGGGYMDGSEKEKQNGGIFETPAATLLEVEVHKERLQSQLIWLAEICQCAEDDEEGGVLLTTAASAKNFNTGSGGGGRAYPHDAFPRGGRLLSYLFECATLSADQRLGTDPLFRFLFEQAFEPYRHMLACWLFNGELRDPFNEFMIETTKDGGHALRGVEDIPVFLRDVALEVLECGTTVLAIERSKSSPHIAICRPAQDMIAKLLSTCFHSPERLSLRSLQSKHVRDKLSALSSLTMEWKNTQEKARAEKLDLVRAEGVNMRRRRAALAVQEEERREEDYARKSEILRKIQAQIKQKEQDAREEKEREQRRQAAFQRRENAKNKEQLERIKREVIKKHRAYMLELDLQRQKLLWRKRRVENNGRRTHLIRRLEARHLSELRRLHPNHVAPRRIPPRSPHPATVHMLAESKREREREMERERVDRFHEAQRSYYAPHQPRDNDNDDDDAYHSNVGEDDGDDDNKGGERNMARRGRSSGGGRSTLSLAHYPYSPSTGAAAAATRTTPPGRRLTTTTTTTTTGDNKDKWIQRQFSPVGSTTTAPRRRRVLSAYLSPRARDFPSRVRYGKSFGGGKSSIVLGTDDDDYDDDDSRKIARSTGRGEGREGGGGGGKRPKSQQQEEEGSGSKGNNANKEEGEVRMVETPYGEGILISSRRQQQQQQHGEGGDTNKDDGGSSSSSRRRRGCCILRVKLPFAIAFIRESACGRVRLVSQRKEVNEKEEDEKGEGAVVAQAWDTDRFALWRSKKAMNPTQQQSGGSSSSSSSSKNKRSSGKESRQVLHSAAEGDVLVMAVAPSSSGPLSLRLRTVFGRCLTESIRLQSEIVHCAMCHLLKYEFRLNDHLGALKNFFLMNHGDLFDTLSRTFFDGIYSDPPINWLNTSNLNHALRSAIRLCGYDKKDPLATNFSFGMKSGCDLRNEKMMLGLRSLGALGHAELQYDVGWPLSLVITKNILSRYAQIFSFLLKIKRLDYELGKLWGQMALYKKSKKTMAVHREHPEAMIHWRSVEMFLMETRHLVSNIQGYIMTQALWLPWKRLQKNIDAAETLADMRNAHVRYISVAYNRCFQSKETKKVRAYVERIFERILAFKTRMSAGIANADAELGLDDRTFEDLRDIIRKTRGDCRLLFRVMRALARKGFAPMLDLVTRLDYNGYFSGALSASK